MIAGIRGQIIHRAPPVMVVALSNGIAYELHVPLSIFSALPESQTEISLYTCLAVREDAMTLYGFLTRSEQSLFKLLIKVSGIGPKLAMAILSSMDCDTFVQTVRADNSTALTGLPGVGKKTAQRLIVELKDKLKTWSGATTASEVALGTSHEQEAIEALLALGYKANEASRMVGNIDCQQLSVEEIIKQVLQGLPA